MGCRKFHQYGSADHQVKPDRHELLHRTKQPSANFRTSYISVSIRYFRLSGTTMAANPPTKTRCPALPEGGKKAPLTFAAGLVGDSDLESTVTILQQDSWGFGPGGGPNEALGIHRAPRTARENHPGHVPKSWANAGAFSLLTPKSKLAHY
jgi:hypothetical protein